MKVWVLSRMLFNDVLNDINDSNVEEIQDDFFISILDTSGIFSKKFFKEDHHNALTLMFDDVVEDGKPSPTVQYNTKAFSDEQAEILYNFIMKNKHKKMCIVHCAAGISRSGAIGTFINDLFGENYHIFKRRNPRAIPNPLIMNKLKNLYLESNK